LIFHGLGIDVTNHFLSGLRSLSDSNLPTHAPQELTVKTEKNSTGDNRPDIILYDESQFFVCIELKLYPREGDRQTERYILVLSSKMLI